MYDICIELMGSDYRMIIFKVQGEERMIEDIYEITKRPDVRSCAQVLSRMFHERLGYGEVLSFHSHRDVDFGKSSTLVAKLVKIIQHMEYQQSMAPAIKTEGDTIAHGSMHEAMQFELEQAPKDHFGPLPRERQYADAIEGVIEQYNQGLISSYELFNQMYLKAFLPVEAFG